MFNILIFSVDFMWNNMIEKIRRKKIFIKTKINVSLSEIAVGLFLLRTLCKSKVIIDIFTFIYNIFISYIIYFLKVISAQIKLNCNFRYWINAYWLLFNSYNNILINIKEDIMTIRATLSINLLFYKLSFIILKKYFLLDN